MSVLHQMLEVKERLVKQRKDLGEHLLGHWLSIEERLGSAKPDANHGPHWQGNGPAPADDICARPKLTEVNSELLKDLSQDNTLWGDWFYVSQQVINEFGAVTGDQQWIHVDEAKAAEESPYRSTVAHGFLLLSLIPSLVPKRSWHSLLGCEPSLIINIGLDEVRFINALKANSHLRASTRTLTVTAIKRGYRVVEKITLEARPARTIASTKIIYRLVCDSTQPAACQARLERPGAG